MLKQSDVSNNRGNWNHLKVIHTWKARNQETRENSHTGHNANTSENTGVKVQNVYHEKQHYT